MSNITQADIDRAMEIINTPFGGDRGMAILSKSNYMYLCGMVQAMTKRIAELEAELKAYKFALENAIIDRTLGGNTPLAQYVAEAIAELNRQAPEDK
jgi:hypothetical protein